MTAVEIGRCGDLHVQRQFGLEICRDGIVKSLTGESVFDTVSDFIIRYVSSYAP